VLLQHVCLLPVAGVCFCYLLIFVFTYSHTVQQAGCSSCLQEKGELLDESGLLGKEELNGQGWLQDEGRDY
jgi:hypothetical protein